MRLALALPLWILVDQKVSTVTNLSLEVVTEVGETRLKISG
jgi:hypothetical protein